MNLPRQAFTILGVASLLAAVALAGTTFGFQGSGNVQAVGDSTPTADPTIDPCVDAVSEGSSELVMAQSPECTPTQETPPKTHTPTPEGTSEPTSPPATEPASTSTTAPPVSTSTPSGGNEGAEVQPPSTGSGGDGTGTSLNWLVIGAGLILAIGGTGALGYGLRKDG